MSKKVLVVVAHPDDEILGVGGTILKHVKNGDKVDVLILGDGETSRDGKADIAKRQNQAKRVGEALGTNVVLHQLPDNKFDSLPLLDIIKKVEKEIYQIKPEIIYTHNPSDLNVDHRLTFEAVMTCCRPQPNFFVKKILAFETLSSTEWQAKNPQQMFCPTEYVDIGKFVDKKIKALEIYKDEMREYPHPRSVEGVKVLAKFRGMEVGLNFAEAFQIIRLLS